MLWGLPLAVVGAVLQCMTLESQDLCSRHPASTTPDKQREGGREGVRDRTLTSGGERDTGMVGEVGGGERPE